MFFSSSKRKRILSVVLTILVLFVVICNYAVFLYLHEYDERMDNEAVSLSGYHQDLCSNLIRLTDFSAELNKLTNIEALILLEMDLSNLINSTQESFQAYQESDAAKTKVIDYYELDEQLQVTFQLAGLPLELSADELKQLITDGYLTVGERCYVTQLIGDIYVVLARNSDLGVASDLDFELTKVYPYIVLNPADGKVVLSDLGELTEAFPAVSPADFEGEVIQTIDELQIRRITVQEQSYLCAVKDVSINGKSLMVCLLAEDGEAQQEAFFIACCSAFTLLLFALCCIFLLIRLQKKRPQTSAEALSASHGLHRHHSFRFHLYRFTAGTLASFLLGAVLLFSMQNIMQINNSIDIAFQNLSLLNESSTQNRQILIDRTYDAVFGYLNVISEAFGYEYEGGQEEWLKTMAEITYLDELTLYDENGQIELSTTPYKGYHLSKNEEDPEYQLWQLLDGDVKQLIFENEENGKIYLAMRRTDKVGILLAVTTNNSISNLLSTVDFADLLTVQYLPNADKCYSTRSSPEVLYILKSGSTIKKMLSNTLPLPDNGEKIIGMREIDGQYYLYISSGSEEWATIFAYPVEELLEDNLNYLLLSFGAYLTLTALLMLILHKRKPAEDSSCDPSGRSWQIFVAEKKMVFSVIVSVLAFTLASFILIEANFFRDSIFLSDFFGCWEKGINPISCSFVLLSVGIFLGLLVFLHLLNHLLDMILSSKGKTVSMLIFSVVKVLVIAAFVIESLEQFGVNATAITASLGLTGLALSIGCKDVISDLVAGTFIIFEGQIQLGDFIQVNSFSGVVKSLGIRTTKIKSLNSEMILNNSSLKNVINQSRGDALLSLTPVLPSDTDLKKLKNVVEEANQRFQDACDGLLLSQIRFVGVKEFTNTGLICLIQANCPSAKKTFCENVCRAELITLLQEHGIRPRL